MLRSSLCLLATVLCCTMIVGALAACSEDSDCPSGNKCCVYANYEGVCYNPDVETCSTCWCQGCSALPSRVCSKDSYGPHATCCIDQCVNPDTTLCCAYHAPHSLSPWYSLCPNNGSNECCGSSCRNVEHQSCCPYVTGDVQFYSCSLSGACCGVYGCCAEGYLCSEQGPSGTCVPEEVNRCADFTCGPTDECCEDLTYGPVCYNPNTHACIFSQKSNGRVLCGRGDDVCGTQCFDPMLYRCDFFNSYTLNQKCDFMCYDMVTGATCYDPDIYVCTTDDVSTSDQRLCPVGNDSCGGVCYETDKYECQNGDIVEKNAK